MAPGVVVLTMVGAGPLEADGVAVTQAARVDALAEPGLGGELVQQVADVLVGDPAALVVVQNSGPFRKPIALRVAQPTGSPPSARARSRTGGLPSGRCRGGGPWRQVFRGGMAGMEVRPQENRE